MTEGKKKRFSRLTLTQKILFWSLLGFLVNIYLLVVVSESQLEKAMLSQVYKQAQSYLFGLAMQLEILPVDATPAQYLKVINAGMSMEHQEFLHFSPKKIYLYSSTGKIISHTQPGEHPDKPMDGVYGKVIRKGKPVASTEIATIIKNKDVNPHLTIDIIVPVRLGGQQFNAGLEAELDMAELLHLITMSDDVYEKRIFVVTTASGLTLFFFVWWLLHRLAIRHINLFSEITRKFGLGVLKIRIPLPLPKDEIGDLGRSINSMADNIGQLMQEQEESYLQMLQSLSKALAAKDGYTQSHSARVSKYAVMLGRYLGLPEEKLTVLQKGALMHDLGKIGVPDAILNKPSALTEEEFSIMRGHAGYTATIMRPLNRFNEFLEIAAWHHEHWNGQGYPDGLAGEEIPLLARIVSIADTWDAMTGDRVYRQGMSKEKALGILEAEWDLGQWDPQLVKSFIAMIKQEKKEQYASA